MAGTSPTGAKGLLIYPVASPSHWYYLIAQCDWDAVPALNAWYYQRGDSNELGYENACR